MSTEFWEKMDQYQEAFGEYFPTEVCLASDTEMMALMDKAIASGTPYDPGKPDGCTA